MKVLFVASESSPFIKTGGLGDVMGALPPALKRLGLDVKVVLPKYKNMKYEFQQKLQFIKLFTVEVGWRNQYCGVSQCEYNGVTYYFLDRCSLLNCRLRLIAFKHILYLRIFYKSADSA